MIMKKIFLILAAGVAVTLTSCIKDAEVTAYVTPETKNEIASEDPGKIFDAAVAGIYNNVHASFLGQQSHNYFGQKGFDYLTSLMGNDMVMTGRYGMSLYHHIFDYWQENYGPAYYRWTENYQHIADANNILKSISADETKPEVLKYKALAQATRGYAYLHLSYLFQLPYYMGAEGTAWGMNTKYSGSNADAPGVVIIKEDTDGDQPRSTVGEIYALILSDLTEAYDFFEANGMLYTPSHTDFDGLVVANYLMRTHMIMHNWTEAEKYAKVIVDTAPLGSAADLLQGFSDINLKNVIFGCDVTADNTGTYASFFSQMDMFGQGYAAIGVARVAHNYLTAAIADNDIRLDWFFNKRNFAKLCTEFGGQPSSLAFYDQSCKFIGAGRSVVYGNWHLGDEIFLRSEEAHFCLAEIYAHQKQYTKAIEVLENIMKIRQADYKYAGQQNVAELVSEINLQKRIEFWGEGIEYLDNRRLNIPVDRTAEGTNHISWAQGVWTQDMPNFLYQIPIDEIDANTMIGPEDQN